MAEWSCSLDSSSGVVRMWVQIPVCTVVALVSLSKTLDHHCFGMGRKAVGPVCCVMHVKEPRTLIVKEKGLAPVFLVFLDLRLEHPAGWICARYKSSVLLLLYQERLHKLGKCSLPLCEKVVETQHCRIPIDPAILAVIEYRLKAKK